MGCAVSTFDGKRCNVGDERSDDKPDGRTFGLPSAISKNLEAAITIKVALLLIYPGIVAPTCSGPRQERKRKMQYCEPSSWCWLLVFQVIIINTYRTRGHSRTSSSHCPQQSISTGTTLDARSITTEISQPNAGSIRSKPTQPLRRQMTKCKIRVGSKIP